MINIYIKIYYIFMLISLKYNYIPYKINKMIMEKFTFILCLVPLFIYTLRRRTFSEIPKSLIGKRQK